MQERKRKNSSYLHHASPGKPRVWEAGWSHSALWPQTPHDWRRTGSPLHPRGRRRMWRKCSITDACTCFQEMCQHTVHNYVHATQLYTLLLPTETLNEESQFSVSYSCGTWNFAPTFYGKRAAVCVHALLV